MINSKVKSKVEPESLTGNAKKDQDHVLQVI